MSVERFGRGKEVLFNRMEAKATRRGRKLTTAEGA